MYKSIPNSLVFCCIACLIIGQLDGGLQTIVTQASAEENSEITLAGAKGQTLSETSKSSVISAITLGLLLEDASQAPLISFVDVTGPAGISSTHAGASCMGQAWGDVNRDGWLDLYLTDSNGPNRLYINQGDGTFIISPHVSPSNRSCGAVFGDIDNDGWIDLYVTNHGPNILYRNNAGVLENISDSAGVGEDGLGTIAAFGDYDNDGYLDIYLGNHDSDRPDILFHNDGSGSFSIANSNLDTVPLGLAFAVSFVDYDNDQDLDIYIVNDKHGIEVSTPWFRRNLLYRNDGPSEDGWSFTETAVAAGADAWIDGMGLAIGDYDLNGTLDFYMTHTSNQVLLQNTGAGTFNDVSTESNSDFDAIGWGTVFADFDLDGWPDLYLSTSNHRNRVFRNLGTGKFDDVSSQSGADHPGRSMGVAYADYDRDGDIDLVVGNSGSGYRLYENAADTSKRWVGLRLEGAGNINRDGIGARATLLLTDGRHLLQEVKSGSSLGAGNDLALRFGLGEADPISLLIEWPDGSNETISPVPLNEEILLLKIID